MNGLYSTQIRNCHVKKKDSPSKYGGRGKLAWKNKVRNENTFKNINDSMHRNVNK